MSPSSLRILALGLIGLGAVGCHTGAKSQALTTAAPAVVDAKNVPAPPPVPKLLPGDYVEGYRQPTPSHEPLQVPKDARFIQVE